MKHNKLMLRIIKLKKLNKNKKTQNKLMQHKKKQ